jgi:histidinol-phosphate aminotransferase
MNEMYKAPPKEVLNPIRESISEINRYTPQKNVDYLIEKLSNYAGVPKETIFLSSGSDLIIKEFTFLFSNNRQIIIADPTFVIINSSAQNAESSLIKIKIKEPDFKLPIEAILDQLTVPSLLVFDNPNNPTGSIILTQKEITSILEHENTILLIDEAYFEFSKVSHVNLIKDYANIAVLRTLSKAFGLAGSGIGYLIAGELIRKKFQGLEIMLPYPSVIGGTKALENPNYMNDYVNEVETEKNRLIQRLLELGINVYPGYTNFLLIKTTTDKITEKLAKQGILVYNLSDQLGTEFCRLTIGSRKENDYFLNSITKILDRD